MSKELDTHNEKLVYPETGNVVNVCYEFGDNGEFEVHIYGNGGSEYLRKTAESIIDYVDGVN